MNVATMDCRDVERFLSAFVDMDFYGLSPTDVVFLGKNIHDCPECSRELQLDIATKSYLHRRRPETPCPQPTVDSVLALVYHMYKTMKASYSMDRHAGN